MKLPMVRIKYWQQETMESGRWVLTGLMSVKSAKVLIDSKSLERGRIVDDSEFT